MTTFASADWATQLAAALGDSAPFRTASVTWVFGPVLLVADADAERSFDGAAFAIDVHEGACRGVSMVNRDDAARFPFVVEGGLARWEAVFGGTQSIVDGILDSRLRAKGDLPTLVRHRDMLDALATVAGTLGTEWPAVPAPA